MRTWIKFFSLLVLTSSVAGPAQAGSYKDFVIYGVERVKIGHSSKVLSGNVGSHFEVNMAAGTRVEGNVHSGGTFGHNGGSNAGVSGNLYINGDTRIGTGSTIGGDVHSSGEVHVRKNADVLGTVYYAPSGSLTLGQGATVGGSVMGTPQAPDLPSAKALKSFTAGGASIIKGGAQTTALLPGSYDVLDLGTGNILQMSAGDYYFNEIGIGSGSDLVFDATDGRIRIFVKDSIDGGSGIAMEVLNGDASMVYMETGGDFRMAGGAHVLGTVYAPNGTIHVGSGGSKSYVEGALWGNEISIEHNVQIVRNPVPEPEALALFLAGLLITLVQIRRRQSV